MSMDRVYGRKKSTKFSMLTFFEGLYFRQHFFVSATVEITFVLVKVPTLGGYGLIFDRRDRRVDENV